MHDLRVILIERTADASLRSIPCPQCGVLRWTVRPFERVQLPSMPVSDRVVPKVLWYLPRPHLFPSRAAAS